MNKSLWPKARWTARHSTFWVQFLEGGLRLRGLLFNEILHNDFSQVRKHILFNTLSQPNSTTVLRICNLKILANKSNSLSHRFSNSTVCDMNAVRDWRANHAFGGCDIVENASSGDVDIRNFTSRSTSYSWTSIIEQPLLFEYGAGSSLSSSIIKSYSFVSMFTVESANLLSVPSKGPITAASSVGVNRRRSGVRTREDLNWLFIVNLKNLNS